MHSQMCVARRGFVKTWWEMESARNEHILYFLQSFQNNKSMFCSFANILAFSLETLNVDMAKNST